MSFDWHPDPDGGVTVKLRRGDEVRFLGVTGAGLAVRWYGEKPLLEHLEDVWRADGWEPCDAE